MLLTHKFCQLPIAKDPSPQSLQKFTQVQLITNHHAITFKDDNASIHIYSITISDDLAKDSREIISDLMSLAKEQIHEAGLKQYTISGNNLWSEKKVSERITAIVKYKGKEFTIYINYVKEAFFKYLIGENDSPEILNQLLQALNVKIKNALLNLGYKELNRLKQYFNPKEINLNKCCNLKAWLGYKTTTKHTKTKPQLVIDFTSRVLSQESVLEFMNKFKGSREQLKFELEDKSILTTYGNFKMYKISGIDFNQNPCSKFQMVDGREVTYLQYYQNQYKVTINNLKQPLLIITDKKEDKLPYEKRKKYYFIPELVIFTGLTDDQRANFKLMQALADHTRKNPNARLELIQSLLKQLQLQLTQFEISSDSTTRGNICPEPQLRDQQGKISLQYNGQFYLKRALKSLEIKDWIIIYQSINSYSAKDFVRKLQQQGSAIGVTLHEPIYISMKDNSSWKWVDELDYEFKKQLPKLVVSLIDKKKDKHIYDSLKDYLLNKIGIVHQNLTRESSIHKKCDAIANKIAQQISAKLGNPLWEIPKIKGFSNRIMIIGIDVYHKSKNMSCIGFVAHFDQQCQTYFSKSMIVKERKELNPEVGNLFKEALGAHQQYSGFFPDQIIIYRDGVGDSQVDKLLTIELESMKANINGKIPQIAYILVNKRISDRFFMNKNDAPSKIKDSTSDSFINPLRGTIISDRITSKYFDFYMVSQYVSQGTCTPTHYTVLYNTTTIEVEDIWLMTYYQCYNYQNWAGPVKVPACVQYAHKLAYLIGDSMKKDIHKSLQDKPVYL